MKINELNIQLKKLKKRREKAKNVYLKIKKKEKEELKNNKE